MARRCDNPVDAIRQFAADFAHSRTAVGMARTGISLGRNGSLSEWLSQVPKLVSRGIGVVGGRVLGMAWPAR